MKAILSALLLVGISLPVLSLNAKTCKAVFNGKLKKQEIFPTNPFVFYPRSFDSRIAQWGGPTTTKAFVTPAAIDIECGTNTFKGDFGPFKATGMLPHYIETFPWETTGFDGKPTIVPPEKLYGFGDSGDYPNPPVYFNSAENIVVEQEAPAGVKDICEVKTLKVTTDQIYNTEMEPDYLGVYYLSTDIYGPYRWDNTKSPKGFPVQLELEDPTVTIMCEDEWEYELEMDWPFIVGADDPSLCGPGEIHRNMKVKGHFMALEDNSVIGYIDVDVPTVTYSGGLWGAYKGSKFSQKLTGKLYTDEAGKSWVEIETLEGGHGITWQYKLSCQWGESQVYNAFAAVYQYLWIYNVEENLSDDANIKLPAEGEDRTIVVDKGGQGTVTFKRSFKRVK